MSWLSLFLGIFDGILNGIAVFVCVCFFFFFAISDIYLLV